MTLKNDGNVGIGLEVPQAKLDVNGDIRARAQGDLRLADSDSSNYIALQAPATVASDVTWTLPASDGTSGQVMTTNGSGTLTWTNNGAGSNLWTQNVNDIYYATGNVGIGKTSPGEKLEINGPAKVWRSDSATYYTTFSQETGDLIIDLSGAGAHFKVDFGGDQQVQSEQRWQRWHWNSSGPRLHKPAQGGGLGRHNR